MWFRRFALLLGVVVLGYVAVCSYFWATQKQHIFHPETELQTTPERDGMPFQVVHIPVGSGADQGVLYGWWIPADKADAPTIYYLHGNFRNVSNDLIQARLLHEWGYNQLLIDYRGFGPSTGGPPSEAKTYEDAEAGWNYLIRQRGVAPQRTFIYGHSLGGAIAIDLALRHPDAAGLILESTFTSMQAMGELDYGFLPVHLLLNQYYDSTDKISRIKVPVLLFHGTWDKTIPYQMSQQLYDRAPQPKMLLLIKGGEHNNSCRVASVECRASIDTFIKRYTH
ncbi:MAG: alpha/beta fold hydrolase [Sideroxydans sp.]|nr:alpha/beta fold hydrolase [Sideroxydans sp.]